MTTEQHANADSKAGSAHGGGDSPGGETRDRHRVAQGVRRPGSVQGSVGEPAAGATRRRAHRRTHMDRNEREQLVMDIQEEGSWAWAVAQDAQGMLDMGIQAGDLVGEIVGNMDIEEGSGLSYEEIRQDMEERVSVIVAVVVGGGDDPEPSPSELYTREWCEQSGHDFGEVWDHLCRTSTDEELDDVGYVEQVLNYYTEGEE